MFFVDLTDEQFVKMMNTKIYLLPTSDQVSKFNYLSPEASCKSSLYHDTTISLASNVPQRENHYTNSIYRWSQQFRNWINWM